MIKIDYKLSNVDYSDEKIVNASSEELHYDLFLGDVVFKIEGTDFSTNWGWVPVLDFYICIINILNDLPKNKILEFEFTESNSVIKFELIGAKVKLSSSYSNGVEILDLSSLINLACETYEKLIEELMNLYPILNENDNFKKLNSENSIVCQSRK